MKVVEDAGERGVIHGERTQRIQKRCLILEARGEKARMGVDMDAFASKEVISCESLYQIASLFSFQNFKIMKCKYRIHKSYSSMNDYKVNTHV